MRASLSLALASALVLTAAGSGVCRAGDCPHSFDVVHYNVTLTIDIDGETLSGNTVLRAACVEPGLDSIALDLAVLTVDSVLSEGIPLAYDHDDPVLSVHLARTYAPGDTFEVQIFYGGHPGHIDSDEMGGFYFAGVPKRAFQVGIDLASDPPAMARYWIPCWDGLCDKATAEFHITIPGTSRKVICNGVLSGTEIDTLLDRSTFHWLEDFPVAPCLMTVNAGKYAEIVDSTYDWVRYWVYPRHVEAAAVHFEHVPAMLDVFAAAFGAYPFPKCAYVAVPTADLSHQNCITHPASAITTTSDNDWRVSDGLTRQWWGACVTAADWRDIWLTESFGRYGQPLFEEANYGPQAYHEYIYENLMLHTFADADEASPIYAPFHSGGHTIFEKGTVVLHMLRFVLGDSVFFDVLRTFRQDYAYGSATTADFEATAEAVSGENLDWFFSEWIYGCGWPEFEYAWNAVPSGSSWAVSLAMDQVQTVAGIFTMPVEIGLTTAGGDTVVEIWVDEAHEEFGFLLSDVPLSLEVDPDHWVLMKVSEVPCAGLGVVDTRATGISLSARPIPSRGGVRLFYSVPTTQHLRIGVYDVAGRLIACLVDGDVPAGPGEVAWDGTSCSGRQASPGVYFCRMVAEQGLLRERVMLVR
jgi:aminopeptidase N